MSEQNTLAYDVVIVGGGIVGLTTALLLSTLNMKIAVLERNSTSQAVKHHDDDIRASAISPASMQLFQTIDIRSDIAFDAGLFNKVEVWDAEGEGKLLLDCVELYRADLGYIIENQTMLVALKAKATASTNIQLYDETELSSLHYNDNKTVMLKTKLANCFKAKLVIAADGKFSWVRQQIGGELMAWEYGQSSVVTAVKTEKPHEKVARQRFLATGPLAFLPMKDEKMCSIVWSTSPEEAKRLMGLSNAAFIAALEEAIEKKLGHIEWLGKRQTYPLSMQNAKSYIDKRIVLVGDAAHTIHPLAGQGLNLGLADALAIYQCIRDAWAKQKDIGHHHLLRKYARARKAAVMKSIIAMEGIKRLFSTDKPFIAKGRNLGMNTVNKIPLLKKAIMNEAIH